MTKQEWPAEHVEKRPVASLIPYARNSRTQSEAGEQTGRHIYAMELSPEYVDVAVERWQNFTGQTATLEETGQTFTEMKEARHGAKG